MNMVALLKTLIEPLVDYKDDLVVKELTEDAYGYLVYEVIVNKEDIGRVIGRRGNIAKAIRTVCFAAAMKNNKKIKINIDHF